MKNVFALTLIAVATFVMASNCQAYQGRPDRQGPPGDRQFGGGPPQGRGGPGGQRGERGERGGPGGQRGGQRGGPGAMEIPIIKALDADNDGKISTAEMANAATALATLDANNDGMLDRTEMMPARPERGGRRGGGPGGPGGPGGQRGGGEDGANGANGANGFVDRMMENDTDGDGKVSSDEAPERMQGFFDRLDGDKDGYLTKEEMIEASKQWSGGGGRNGAAKRPRRPASE